MSPKQRRLVFCYGAFLFFINPTREIGAPCEGGLFWKGMPSFLPPFTDQSGRVAALFRRTKIQMRFYSSVFLCVSLHASTAFLGSSALIPDRLHEVYTTVRYPSCRVIPSHPKIRNLEGRIPDPRKTNSPSENVVLKTQFLEKRGLT